MTASRNGNANAVAVLLDAGANVNARDEAGMTALMHAAGGVETAEAAQALLEAEADKSTRDKNGRTALRIAERSNCMGSDKVRDILRAVVKDKVNE